MTEEISTAVKKAKAVLVDNDGNPTSQFAAYLKYQQEWNNKKDAYSSAYKDATADAAKLQMWPIEGRSYHDDSDNAWNKWIALGYKTEVEKALAILSAFAKDPAIANIIQQVKS